MDVILTNPCGEVGLLVQERLEAAGVHTLMLTRPSAKKQTDYFLREVHRVAEESGAAMALPVFFPEVLSAHRHEFGNLCIPVDSAEKLDILDNKRKACLLAEEIGIPQPQRYEKPSDVAIFPTVFKRCTGQGGDSVYFPKTPKALENIIKTASDYIITDYIEGEKVSVDAIRYGDFYFGASYRILEPQGKGVSTLRESVCAPELEGSLKAMLDHIDYQGICGADFLVDKDGKAWFLECNPRFSGGLESAVASGFDIPNVFFKLVTGQKVGKIVFKPGIITGSR